jgi:glycosyltransferase involved in cell wall biosynthesis
MIRIAYIVSVFPKLSETFVFREINELRRQGAEVICLSIHRSQPEPLPPDARHFAKETTYLWPPNPVQFIFAMLRFVASSPSRFFGTLGIFLRRAPRNLRGTKRFLLHFLEGVYLAHLCTRCRIAYIHAHFANGPSSVAMAASALAGIPFGFTCHAQDIYSDPLMLDLKMERATVAFTISAFNRNYLLNNYAVKNPERLKVQKVAIDLAHFRPGRRPRRETPLILTVGRLVPKKGFIHLIRACELLAQQGVNFQCWIIGDGPERPALQSAIVDARLQETVVLLGAQAQVKRFLQQADLFVMPCVLDESGDRDGIPTTLMEAMAMELPVISTDLSGIPELVTDELNGLLVPPADPEALAHAIARLLGDEKLRRKLGASARRFVENNHNLETNTRQLLQTILTAVDRKKLKKGDNLCLEPTPSFPRFEMSQNT